MILNYMKKFKNRIMHRQVEYRNGFTFMRMKTRGRKNV